MVLLTVSTMALVVVSKSGRRMMELNLAASAWKPLRESGVAGMGWGGSGSVLQPARIAAKPQHKRIRNCIVQKSLLEIPKEATTSRPAVPWRLGPIFHPI